MDSALRAGDRVLVDGTMLTVDATLAGELTPGDRLVAAGEPPDLRRIPAAVARLVEDAVDGSVAAFRALRDRTDAQVTRFFDLAASLLDDPAVIEQVGAANRADMELAKERGRSTARLELGERARASMVEGLRMWRDFPAPGGNPISTIDHRSWLVEEWRAPLGVVGFVFEGRPNVLVDATGVLRSGNTAVFRIGSDALRTAVALMSTVVEPALAGADLPPKAVVLLESVEHSAGWSLFADRRLSLAVARGSGEAVRDLGSIARRAGTPVSLHGTGGAWMLVDTVDEARLGALVENSLDRKVCNTLNVVCVTRRSAETAVPVIVRAADHAAARSGVRARWHAVGGAGSLIAGADETIEVHRAGDTAREPRVSDIARDEIGREHEWELNPELTLVVVESLDEAIELFNCLAPRFVVSVVVDDGAALEAAWRLLEAPFVGDGFTRWVDGQFALGRPELGLSNWQHGRLFGRGGVLSGDSVHTVRLRARQSDPGLHR